MLDFWGVLGVTILAVILFVHENIVFSSPVITSMDRKAGSSSQAGSPVGVGNPLVICFTASLLRSLYVLDADSGIYVMPLCKCLDLKRESRLVMIIK